MDPTNMPSPSHSNSDGGGWSSVVQNKKGKGKKKKLKNARTLSLQTFFSEHGGGPDNEQIRDDLKGLPEIAMPELSSEDLVVRESLFSYFSDVLKRLGPVKVNGPELQAELNHLSEEGKDLVGRHLDIAAFIGQSSQLVIIDDYVCSKEDSDRARNLALESIVTIVAARNNKNSSTTTLASLTSQTVSTPPATVWNSHSPAISKPSVESEVDSWLQMPKVESLFTNFDSSSPSNLMSNSGHFSSGLSSHLKPPDLSSPPPTLQRSASASVSNGFSSAATGSSRFGGLGSTSNFSSDPQYQTNIESLNKRIQGLSLCNADLLAQLATKERQLQHFSKLIGPQEELSQNHEKLKLELEDSKKEITRLQKIIDSSDSGGEKNSDKPPVSDNYLIISLQHQLESERLNSRNLKHQLELEREYSKKITDKHNYLLNRFHSSGSNPMSPGGPVLGGLCEPGGGGVRHSQDSFGLRGLLANTSSGFRDEGSRFTGGTAVTPPISSSVFSGTPNRPMSFSPALQPPQSTASPPLLNSMNKFSSSFGGGSELGSLSEEFQSRLMTSSAARVGLQSPTTQPLVNLITSQLHKQ